MTGMMKSSYARALRIERRVDHEATKNTKRFWFQCTARKVERSSKCRNVFVLFVTSWFNFFSREHKTRPEKIPCESKKSLTLKLSSFTFLS